MSSSDDEVERGLYEYAYVRVYVSCMDEILWFTERFPLRVSVQVAYTYKPPLYEDDFCFYYGNTT